MGQLADLLKHNKVELQLRLKHFMQMVVASFESLSQASVQAAPRLFDGNSMSKSVGISQVARNLSKYDGGSDLFLLREMPELTTEQQQYLESAAEADWRRPLLPVDDGSGLLPNIHPASRGVAAHTAGLFRSVRGAKGGFPRGGSPS